MSTSPMVFPDSRSWYHIGENLSLTCQLYFTAESGIVRNSVILITLKTFAL
jgi:hypothetical protein